MKTISIEYEEKGGGRMYCSSDGREHLIGGIFNAIMKGSMVSHRVNSGTGTIVKVFSHCYFDQVSNVL